MSKEIKCLIFDAGRVIVDYDNSCFFNLIEKRTGLNIDEARRKTMKSIREYDKGCASFSEFYEEASKVLDFSNLTYNEFKEKYLSIPFSYNKEIEKVFRMIKPEIRRVLLSNVGKLHWNKKGVLQENLKKLFPLKKQRIASFQAGCAKPSPKAFKKALSVYKMRPEQTVFIDDNRKFLAGFRKMGGHTIRYSCREHTIEYLEKKLRKYSVLKK